MCRGTVEATSAGAGVQTGSPERASLPEVVKSHGKEQVVSTWEVPIRSSIVTAASVTMYKLKNL